MASGGKLSVMAHSMGNIVLSEALYQAESASSDLVDTAILSQGALSSHYYSARTDQLPSIYKADSFESTDAFSRVVQYQSPAYTEYLGFSPNHSNVDAIGGLTPRFRGISAASAKILNYFNPDDFALGTWKLDQALKPTSEWSNGLSAYFETNKVDLGNVNPAASLDDASRWLLGPDKPGFAETEYDLEVAPGSPAVHYFNREYTGATAGTDQALVLLPYAYEMFAFGASSIVAAVGGVSGSLMPGVFSGTKNLPNFVRHDKVQCVEYRAQCSIHSFIQ